MGCYWFFLKVINCTSYGFLGVCSMAIHALSQCVGGKAYVFCFTVVALQLIYEIFGAAGVVTMDRVFVVGESAIENGGRFVNST